MADETDADEGSGGVLYTVFGVVVFGLVLGWGQCAWYARPRVAAPA